MAPPKTSAAKDKRETIIETMLDLVVERGFHDAPMSLLAKRAGASAGVIYHYFASKDEVIHAVYLHVKSLKIHFMLDGQDLNLPFKSAFQHAFISSYNFYRSHHRETRFLDLYESSTFCGSAPQVSDCDVSPTLTVFIKNFRPKKDGGVLRDLPLVAINELSFGVARQLAKKDVEISVSDLEKVAAAAWMAISAD